MWVNAGLELGNHTFSHSDLNDTLLAAYLSDIIRGETITRALLEKKGQELKYFRHTYLHTGQDVETKVTVEQFLRERCYTAVPVTLDNLEWAFAKVYDRAWERGEERITDRRRSRDFALKNHPDCLSVCASCLRAEGCWGCTRVGVNSDLALWGTEAYSQIPVAQVSERGSTRT